VFWCLKVQLDVHVASTCTFVRCVRGNLERPLISIAYCLNSHRAVIVNVCVNGELVSCTWYIGRSSGDVWSETRGVAMPVARSL
jgi:hypothetical protein